MKQDKIKRMIKKAVVNSFENNKLIDKKLEQYIRIFKSLPGENARIYLNLYVKEMRKFINDKTLYITSSIKLNRIECKRIEDKFKDIGPFLATELKVDTSLKGGIQVRIGDTLYSDSISERIKRVGDAIAG